MLHTEPSFCIYNSEDGVVENQDLVAAISNNNSDFTFGKKGMGLIEENENEQDDKEDGTVVNSGDVEGYYNKVLQEDPSSPLFLKNYAQLLQSKGDLSGAEPYYFQATLADPKDGNALSQYAKLVWDLHQDKDRASDYFERAAYASPEDSDVLAAYASFLWEINDDESEDEMNLQSDLAKIEITEDAIASQNLDLEEDNRPVSPPPLHLAAGLGVGDNIFVGSPPVDYTAAISSMNGNAEEYYMRMITEKPHNPLLLRNYAQFLCRSKGDLLGAEEYYSRAILADPTDGETISEYAILIWQLHRDKYKASSYFKRAVQASPEDSDVLAAYARFLWETEEDEDEDETLGDHNGSPLLQGVVTANA